MIAFKCKFCSYLGSRKSFRKHMKEVHNFTKEIINQKLGGKGGGVGFKQQNWVERIEIK